jgi:large repetitive protein
VSDGTHAITAIATSVAGDGSDASNSLAVTIDSVAPTLTVIGISPDTGSSSTDGVTSSGTVTVSGTIDLADTSRAITVLRDGISVGTVTANAVTGVWSLANISLTEGSHTLTAQAVGALWVYGV